MTVLAEVISLRNLREVLDAATVPDLQRAASAIRDGVIMQNMVVTIGLIASQIPTAQLGQLKQINLTALRTLETDPGWLAWGSQIFTLNHHRFSTGLALHSLQLLVTPWLLDDVEAYVGRLKALIPPIEGDLAARLFELSDHLTRPQR